MKELKQKLHSLKGVSFALLLYGLAHSTLRLFASGNLGENDPLSALRSQSFDVFWETGAASFDFLVLALSEVFGPGAFIFQILRYGLLGVSLIFVFLSARRITASPFWALLSVEAYALIYQISWRFHEGFTYPLITMLAVSALFWLFLKIEQQKSVFTILLAVFFTLLGSLTGIWFFAFLLSLAFGLFFVSLTQKRLIFLIIILGLCLGAAHLYQTGFFESEVIGKTAFHGSLKAGLKVIAYLSPLLPILLLVFGLSLKKGIKEPANSFSCWLFYSTCGAVLGVLSVSFFLKDAPFSEHALMPLFFLTPLWFMDLIRRSNPKDWQIKSFVGLCFVLMLVAFFGRAANLYVLDPVCKRCYFGIPYHGLVEKLKTDKAFQKVDKVVTPATRLSGNIYAFWPEKMFLLPHEMVKGNVLAIWPEKMPDKDVVSWLVGKNLSEQNALEQVKQATLLEIDWPHLWRKTGYRQSKWKAIVIKMPLE